ncbi:MAG: FtsX-like permease family protein [bacterium]
MFFKIIFNQARHKWGITLLVFLAITSLVALYVYLRNTTQFANRSMQLIMKNMGHNLLIIPNEADPYDSYFCAENQILFPDNTTHLLAPHLRLASKYYVSVLQERIQIGDREYILTGIEPVKRKDETPEMANLISALKEGEARLGATAAQVLLAAGKESVDIIDSSFHVVETLPFKGGIDDYRIYINLPDCQRILNRSGQINAILAFECLRGQSLTEGEAYQKRELAKVLPGFKQIMKMDIAQGRYMARMTTQRSLYYLLGIVLTVTVLLIAITGLQEVSERTREVGILVSMGANYLYITGLYLVKILILALAASLLGFWIGAELSVWINTSFLVVNTAPIRILWSQLPTVIQLTCLVALLAELVPMVKLLRMDPTATLIEE